MMEALVQKLLNDKVKGFKITFKTDGKNYFVFIGSGRFATLNEKEFNTFYEKWKVANSLLNIA